MGVKQLLYVCFGIILTVSAQDDYYYYEDDYGFPENVLYSTDNNTGNGMPSSSDIAIGAIYIAFTTLGLLANGVVIFVILCGNEITKTVTAIYVVQLAISDCAFLIVLPLFAVQQLQYNWSFSSATCTLFQTVKYVNYYAGIFFLTAMSIDRYIAVVYSTKSRQIRTMSRTFIVCIGVWVASILASLPAMLYSAVVPIGHNETGEKACQIIFPGYQPFNYTISDVEKIMEAYYEDYPTTDNITPEEPPVICNRKEEPLGQNIYEIFRFAIGYMVPFIIITINYILILVQLRRSEKKLSETNRNSTQTNSIRHKVTLMVIALVICFGVCWLPFHLYNMMLIKGFNGWGMSGNWECFEIEKYLVIIGYSNSVLNPLLYTFLGHNFGKRLSDSWKKTRARMQHGTRMVTKGQWRNTQKFQSASASKRFSGHRFSRIPPPKNEQAASTGFTTILTEHEKDGKKVAHLELQPLNQRDALSKRHSDVIENVDHL